MAEMNSSSAGRPEDRFENQQLEQPNRAALPTDRRLGADEPLPEGGVTAHTATPAVGSVADHATGDSSVDLAQILAKLEALVAAIADLQQGFDAKIKYDAVKERMVDSLHKELQTWRDDLHFKLLRPIFSDLIGMHDDIGSLLRHDDAEAPAGDSASLRRNLASFQGTLEEILERNGVTCFTEESEVFIPQRQRATKTIETTDPGKDTKIAQRLRKGFVYGGRVLRPELVYIFKVKAHPRNTEPATQKEA